MEFYLSDLLNPKDKESQTPVHVVISELRKFANQRFTHREGWTQEQIAQFKDEIRQAFSSNDVEHLQKLHAILTHDVGDREGDKNDSLKCPECNSHTVKMLNRQVGKDGESEFSCHSCGSRFHHQVLFSPKSHMIESYKTDESDDYKPYAPGPDDAKKHLICPNCKGYSWKDYHQFSITGGKCPNCNYKPQNVGFDDKGWKNPKQKHHKSSFGHDQAGNKLEVGKPYLMYSPKYKVPDVVYIVKNDHNLVEAAIEGDETYLFPITIDEQEFQKMLYSFEPFYKTAEQLALPMETRDEAQLSIPMLTGDEAAEAKLWLSDLYWQQNSLDNDTDFIDSLDDAQVAKAVQKYYEGGIQAFLRDAYGNTKESWDYSPSTDSMSGHDTGMPIRENPLDYDENVHNQMETGSPAPTAPLDIPEAGNIEKWADPQGRPILTWKDNKRGDRMGWAYDEGKDPAMIIWRTDNLFKVKEGIEMGKITPMSKIARKAFTQTEQQALIDESLDKKARNFEKLNLEGTHYLKKRETNLDDPFWALW